MTEGNGHVIDPNGDARRALLEAVAERGPEVLSDAAVMDSICRDQLTGLPGESILIGDAARSDVPALLNELIPRMGNYGAIQSAATALAGEHNLDMAASLWVVREFARALGYIASGPATGTSASFPGSGPRPVPGSGPRPVPGSGPRPVSGSGPVTGGGTTEREGSPGRGTGGGEGGSPLAAGAAGTTAGAAGMAGTAAGAGAAAGIGGAAGAGRASGAGGAAGMGGAAGGATAGEGGRDGLAEGRAGTSGVTTPGTVGAAADGTGGAGPGTRGAGAGERGAGAGGSVAGRGAASENFASGSGPEGARAGLASGDTGTAGGSLGGTGTAGGSLGGTGAASGPGSTGAASGPGSTGAASGPGSTGAASGPVSPGPADGAPAAGGPGAYAGVQAPGDPGSYRGAQAPGGPGPYGSVQAPGDPGSYGTAQAPGGPGPYGSVQAPGNQGAYGGVQAPGGPGASEEYGGAPGAGGSGGSLWGSAPGGVPEGEPGFPLPLPGGQGPGRRPQRSKVLNRNTVGIAAAIALVAGYLGVAAVAHLSPFPAKAAPPAQSQTSSPPASTNSSPASSPAASTGTSPPSQLEVLMTKIPATIRNQNNQGACLNAGTQFNATAVSQCQHLQGAAQVIIYYLYPSRTALASGLSALLEKAKFHKKRECTSANSSFTDFLVDCQSDYTVKRLSLTGSISEYTNGTQAIIVSTDNDQHVMAVLIGTSAGDLLAYWNQQEWVVHP